MRTKFAEDVIPLTDLKTNPGKVVKHVEKNLAVFRHGVVERLVGGSEVFASRATVKEVERSREVYCFVL